MAKANLLFLGTGGSMGVPVIGCKCAVCQSNSHYNKRLRPSVLIETDKTKIVIDAGPDFRTQALLYNIDHLDGVIFTHAHHDHTSGIDDLRVYYMFNKKPTHCLMSRETYSEIKARYSYIFEKNIPKDKLVSKIDLQLLDGDRGEVDFANLKIKYFSYRQQSMAVNGYRIGNLAYISDIKKYPESIFDDLKDVENLVISAPRFGSLSMHFSIEDALIFSKKIGAKKTWITHLAHEINHEETMKKLPFGVGLAYDGLRIGFAL